MQNKLPKFKVGEVVILQSKRMPVYNGEYTVVDYCPPVCNGESVYEGITYIFTGSPEGTPVYDVSIKDNNRYILTVSEEILFKKHLPSTESYETLMSSLKLGQPVRV